MIGDTNLNTEARKLIFAERLASIEEKVLLKYLKL